MRKIYLLFLLLILPLVISGCFSIAKKVKEIEKKVEKQEVYKNQTLGEAAYWVKYNAAWKVTENSTGQIPKISDQEVKDEVEFSVSKEQSIKVKVIKDRDEKSILDQFEIESQQQTEISRLLASRIIGKLKADNQEKVEVILIKNGDYFYLITGNLPGSPDFTEFLNNLSIINNLNKIDEAKIKDKRPIFKLYFGLNSTKGKDCQAVFYREIYLPPQEDEIGLIPAVIKALLSPDQLKLNELKLFTAIPLGTKLLSYGYVNNKMIVNFSSSLNKKADACEMELRRSQIEKTLISLKDVSNLSVNEVEIQIENSTKNILQP
jgi:hypothetical protein